MTMRILIIAALCAVSGCSATDTSLPPQSPPPLRVGVVEAAEREVAPHIALTGELVPARMLRVVPDVDGLIVERALADVGDRVERGQALIDVDDGGLRLQLIQTHAEREQAAAEVASLRRELARIEQVVAIGGVSANERDQKRVALQASEQRTVALSAARDLVARQLNLARLSAPVAGRILERNVEAGDRTGASTTPYFVIAADDDVEFEAFAGLRQLQPLHEGLLAMVRPADGSAPLRGRVRIAADALAASDRRGKVRIAIEPDALPEPENAIDRAVGRSVVRIGTPATATVMLPARRVLALPAGALRFAPEPWVWVVDADDRVRRRDLRLGAALGDGYEVLDGLRAGERVVADAGALLVAADRIHPLLNRSRPTHAPVGAAVRGDAKTPRQDAVRQNTGAPR